MEADTTGAVNTPAVHLKRALRVWDLTFLCVVAILNLNIVPVIAANGPVTLWLWIAALLLFFLPQGIAVIELSHHLPQEGGIYVWTKEAFGDLHGFLCGWCYWTNNMFYIPTLLFYLVGIVTYTLGRYAPGLSENPVFFFCLAVGLLWVTALANIRGLGVGKWVNNAGGIGAIVTAVLLITLAVFIVSRYGITVPASSFGIEKFDWKIVSSFGVICFGLVGLELGSVMGDEIHDPKQSIPRGVLLGGIISGVLYIGATMALLLAIPQHDVSVVQGILQAIDNMTGHVGAGWVLVPVAFLLSVAMAGATSAWLSGSARILFVSGIDRYLPQIFGRVHPKYGTPHIAIIGFVAFSSALIAMSFVGKTTVKEAYVTLLDLAVVLQMISYLYLYAALARIAFSKSVARVCGTGWTRFAAIGGLISTSIGLVVAFVPSRQVDSVWQFELKMFLTCAVFLGLAVALFIYYSRRQTHAPVIAAEV
ncbi:MAG: APC family permease [Bryobacteraceae bacterium]